MTAQRRLLHSGEKHRRIYMEIADNAETTQNTKPAPAPAPVPVPVPVPVPFRFAGRGDCALILKFIRELAKYEHMEDDVVATEEMIAEWLFDKRAAEVLFAVVDGLEIGFALFFSSFSTFLGRAGMYLEDIYILPEYRRRGYGSAMFKKLANIATKRGYGRFEWACLDWNTPGIKLYQSLGAEPINGWTTYRLSGSALSDLANEE